MSARTNRAKRRSNGMPIIDPPGAVSIMAIAAHPDDIEAWCAGALMRGIANGATARLLLVTSGDKGSGDPLTEPRLLPPRGREGSRGPAKRPATAAARLL